MPGAYPFTVSLSDGNTGTLHQATSQALTLTVKDPGQMTRNDTIAQATPVLNLRILASISPYDDLSSPGSDVDVYSANVVPGTVLLVFAQNNNEFIQPPEPNAMQPVVEIVDVNGNRLQTCMAQNGFPVATFSLPCVNGLGAGFLESPDFEIQVPGTGTAPVPIYVRVADARGDARPDFIYTFGVLTIN